MNVRINLEDRGRAERTGGRPVPPRLSEKVLTVLRTTLLKVKNKTHGMDYRGKSMFTHSNLNTESAMRAALLKC